VAGCCECGDEPAGSCATELSLRTTFGNIIYTADKEQSPLTDVIAVCHTIILKLLLYSV
jgi:hypothetical protein